jgi:hypothetical protein
MHSQVLMSTLTGYTAHQLLLRLAAVNPAGNRHPDLYRTPEQTDCGQSCVKLLS